MLSRTLIATGVAASIASAKFTCDGTGIEIPDINLQLVHLHDMGAGQKVMEFRTQAASAVVDLETAFGQTTETALATFVDKPYSQHEIENTWCYKKEFGFGATPNSAAFASTFESYGTFLGQDYNMGDSQLDPIYIALRRANEFAWKTGDFGANGQTNIRIFSLATNQHPLNAGNYTENSSKPNWSDDAHEDCATVNYPSVEQMQGAVADLKTYFLFLVDSGSSSYGDLVLEYYSKIPNSVSVDLQTVTGTRSTFGGIILEAIKKLLCDVVEWPEPCTVPDTLVPTDKCPCSCKVMAEIQEKFDAHCW